MAAIVYFLYFVFVQQVVSHWWRQYSLLFWVDTIAMDLFSYLPGLEGGFSKDKRFAGLGGPSWGRGGLWRVSVSVIAFDSETETEKLIFLKSSLFRRWKAERGEKATGSLGQV